jgi:hypothetical protein
MDRLTQPALNIAHRASADPGPLRELLLREASRQAKALESCAKSGPGFVSRVHNRTAIPRVQFGDRNGE